MGAQPGVVTDTTRIRRLVGVGDPHHVRDVAELAGITERQMWRILGGERTRYATLDKLACVLGVHYTELLADEEAIA